MDISVENEDTANEKRLLVFILESKHFGIELTRIKEITDLLQTTRLPGAHSYVKGLGNLRGEIIPIVSLRERLKIGGEEKSTQLIIVVGKKINYGLLIDKTEGIFNMKAEVSKSISSIFSKDVETSFLKGVIRVDDKDVILIDCEKLVEINE
jgi:purine-binding chemotaxis protein CheW